MNYKNINIKDDTTSINLSAEDQAFNAEIARARAEIAQDQIKNTYIDTLHKDTAHAADAAKFAWELEQKRIADEAEAIQSARKAQQRADEFYIEDNGSPRRLY